MSNPAVYTWARVYVNGSDVGVHEVDVSAGIANDLPGRLNFGSGITQRTGTIRWSNAMGKGGMLLSPYRRAGEGGFRLPSYGDRIQVRMGVQEADPRLFGFTEGEVMFTGKVDYSDVNSGDYPVTHIVDDIDKLNRVIRLNPFKHHMPPLVGQSGRYRHTGLTPDTVIAWIAQKCGFHTTPLPRGAAYVSAMFHGSTLPTGAWGTIMYSHRTSGDQVNLPLWDQSKDGLALSRGIMDYTAGSSTAQPKTIISAKIGANHKGDAVIHTHLTDNTRLTVKIDANRRVIPQIGDTVYSGAMATVPADTYFSVCFDSAGAITTTTENESKTATAPQRSATAASWITLDASGGGCSIAGLNICGVPSNDSGVLGVGFVPSAIIDAGYQYPLHLSRSIRDEKAIDVLNEICEAICLICYIDGNGKLNFMYGRTAHNRPTRGTLTAKEHVRQFTIKDDSLLGSRQVVLKYKTVEGDFTNRSEGSYVTLWQGSSTQLDAGELKEDIIGPGDGEEWFEIDTAWSYANGTDAEKERFNRKNGSFYGFTTTSGSPGAKSEWWNSGDATVSQIVPWRWKVSLRPAVACSTHIPEVNGVHPSMWGKGMPIIRGGTYAKLVDAEPYVATGGSDSAADLSHEAGAWVTNTRAQDIADYAMKKSLTALPVVKGLECFFDPRIKVGTRWNLDLTATAGVNLQCFVLEVEHDPASDTTRVDVRVLENLTSWVWDSLPENYRTFQAVASDFSNLDELKAGK